MIRGSKRWALALATCLFAVCGTAGLIASGAAAKGSITGNCHPGGKNIPTLPCSASEGQIYSGYQIPDGADDTEAAVEAVVGYVESEDADLTPVAQDLNDSEGDFELHFPNIDNPNADIAWDYSGTATLAFATVATDQGAFAVYDIAKTTHGNIEFQPLLGDDFENATSISFWQRTFTECEPVKVRDTHGSGMIPGCQLSEIANGKVPCMHVTKLKTATCRFRTGKHSSGQWLAGAQHGEGAKYALANQAITRKGKRGGAWVVASKQSRDGELPCRKVPPPLRTKWTAPPGNGAAKRDTASYASDGSLVGSGYTEVAGSTRNVNGSNLQNYATRDVCANTPPPHPDGAPQTGHPSASVWCYSYLGAGMNDMYGVERYSPAQGATYIDDPYHRHFITYTGGTVAAAKRPLTKPNGELLPGYPIAWRTVNPNANIAN